MADDPALTVRGADGTANVRQPLRVVMGMRSIPDSAQVLDQSAPTVHLSTHDPVEALNMLAVRRIHHVWLEGGPTVAAAFLSAGLVDEVIAYLAPVFLGSGPAAVGDLGIQTIDQALRLTPLEITTIGPDIRIRATIDPPPVVTTRSEGH
jgi:diaminohydroxyphosphoribosylaminopyrimidine deaminase/5-amino-6-(5-phosphoribosylamino)uracil reductase